MTTQSRLQGIPLAIPDLLNYVYSRLWALEHESHFGGYVQWLNEILTGDEDAAPDAQTVPNSFRLNLIRIGLQAGEVYEQINLLHESIRALQDSLDVHRCHLCGCTAAPVEAGGQWTCLECYVDKVRS
jgi:hypothetical protein